MMCIFCHGVESKVLQMEQMGDNSWMIVGYHDKVNKNSELSTIQFQIGILCLLHMLFLIEHFWINNRTATFMMIAPKSQQKIESKWQRSWQVSLGFFPLYNSYYTYLQNECFRSFLMSDGTTKDGQKMIAEYY